MIYPLPDRVLEEKVMSLVAQARDEFGIPSVCRGEDACNKIGLTLVRRLLPNGKAGMLTDDNHIVISTAPGRESRAEFTIFHEITHYLLNEDGELYDYLTDIHRSNEDAFDSTIERWCQVGAAEFMLPREAVRACIASDSFSVDLVEKITSINGASILAASIQLAVCAPVDCYVVTCLYGPSPIWPHSPTLYVEQATKASGSQFPIARGTTVPDDHLFRRVWDGKTPLSGPTYIPFRSGKKYPCRHAEAKIVGGRVIGILYLGPPPRKGQLQLSLDSQ